MSFVIQKSLFCYFTKTIFQILKMSVRDLLLSRPRLLENQQFAIALTPDDVLTMVFPAVPATSKDYYRTWQRESGVKDTGSVIQSDKNSFQVHLDVEHFSPNEVTVKVTDGFLIIEGKHDERQDTHGWVSRHFTRRYILPDSCDVAQIQSKLSSDGVLTVTAPMKQHIPTKERIIPIIFSGPIRTQEKVGDAESSQASIDAEKN